MKIGVDFDGVIIDYERVMSDNARFHNLFVLKKDDKEDKSKFFYLDRFNWTKEEKDEFMKLYSKDATMSSPVIPYAKFGIDYLKSIGCELDCITARGGFNKNIFWYVLERLKSESISFDKIFFSAGNKVEVCLSENIDYMIEDNPDNCRVLINNGIKCLYLNTSHGEHLDESEYVIEFDSWIEICEFISKKLNKSVEYTLKNNYNN